MSSNVPANEPVKIENLELNRETLQDLAESESEQAQGGAFAAPYPTNTTSKSNNLGCCDA